ncbi:hypothetical protein STRZYGA_00610 [Brevundimonas phage vB_BpoS-Strzyga]|nr:hypothetical protein STRZYGA_00610 [Brevundimonas phage vB_BpoS-Strzyga]
MASVIAFFLGVGKFLKGIPLRAWLFAAAVILLILAVGWTEHQVRSHVEYVRSIEKSNTDLQAEKVRLGNEVIRLGNVNTANKKTYDESLQQVREARRIAEEERAQAQSRADFYRRARDAANATPQDDRLPVDPVILDTIDRLWDDTARP